MGVSAPIGEAVPEDVVVRGGLDFGFLGMSSAEYLPERQRGSQ